MDADLAIGGPSTDVDIEGKKPEVDVDIKGPKVGVEANLEVRSPKGDASGKAPKRSWSFGKPDIHLPKFPSLKRGQKPKVHVEGELPDVDVEIEPEIKVSADAGLHAAPP